MPESMLVKKSEDHGHFSVSYPALINWTFPLIPVDFNRGKFTNLGQPSLRQLIKKIQKSFYSRKCCYSNQLF